MIVAAPKKCLIWDLDDTLWKGTLLEGEAETLQPRAREVIEELDRRGILMAIASRSEAKAALDRLKAFGLDEFFVAAEIGYVPKSQSITVIAKKLNLDVGAMAFVDDNEADRAEVAFAHPGVACFDGGDLSVLVDNPALKPRFVTPESKRRRELYWTGIERQQAEDGWSGPSEDFQRSLQLQFEVARATVRDLQRMEELIHRTNQLNSTGRLFSYSELRRMINCDHWVVIACNLEDRFGTYGKIGLALVSITPEVWRVSTLIMSCRVMSRGVGSLLLDLIINKAVEAGVRLEMDFVSTGSNRPMKIMLHFLDFTPSGEPDVMMAPAGQARPVPGYIAIIDKLGKLMTKPALT